MIPLDELLSMANQAGFAVSEDEERIYWSSAFGSASDLERFANLAMAYEREECAKVCEKEDEECHESFGAHCAAAIRARGE